MSPTMNPIVTETALLKFRLLATVALESGRFEARERGTLLHWSWLFGVEPHAARAVLREIASETGRAPIPLHEEARRRIREELFETVEADPLIAPDDLRLLRRIDRFLIGARRPAPAIEPPPRKTLAPAAVLGLLLVLFVWANFLPAPGALRQWLAVPAPAGFPICALAAACLVGSMRSARWATDGAILLSALLSGIALAGAVPVYLARG